MPARFTLLIFGLIVQPYAFAAEPHTVKLGAHTFTLPEGFTIELIAGPPLVDRPVNACFDGPHRIYVTDSSGSNDKPTEQIKNPTHRVVRLDSSKKDGVFDKSVVFADKLSFLQGCLWHGGSLYVAAPPAILKLTDTDGDGVADKREVWFDGKSLTGCANDLHGPYRGPDAKIYWTKGGFGTQEHTLKDGKKFKTRASHIFRADADGKNLEVVMTGGMDNPVGLAWVSGELFFSTTFLQHPEAGKRDGLIHNTYGALYGKHHDELEDYFRAGPKLSEPMTHLGPAAPSGLAAYDNSTFGLDFQGNLFCAQFNMAKVSRHILKSKGSTYETLDSDFVKSDNRDFHPTDVVVAADGSLLIVDTGGWYKLCCPSSQLVKKETLGAIYRVRALKPGPMVEIDDLLRLPGLDSRDLMLRRKAVEVLRDKPIPASTPEKLFVAIALDDNDQVLDAGFTRLLVDFNDANLARMGLREDSPRTIRAALAALEQIPDAKLTFAEVEPHLNSKNADLSATSWWIAGRHPDWGKDLAKQFDAALREKPTADLVDHLVRFAGQADVQAVLAENVEQRSAVEAMARAKLKNPPPSWTAAILKYLKRETPDANWLAAALGALRRFPAQDKNPAAWNAEVLKIARDTDQTESLRLLALVVARPGQLDIREFQFVLAQLDGERPATSRSDAADVLLSAVPTVEQARAIIKMIPKVSPLDLEKLLPLFAKLTTDDVGKALVESLDMPKLRAALRGEQVTTLFAGYSKDVRAEAGKLRAKIEDELKSRRANLEKTLAGLEPGDRIRGQAVFNSAKANCLACHKIGYVGGAIGPDLSKIGSIRGDIDLLESIVIPSAGFVRSYEPVTVNRLDGRTHNGILKRDAPDEVVLTISATEEVRIPRSEIDTMKPGSVSIMPAGLDAQLAKRELGDLLAFLKGLK